jgi:hypothetical protein
VIAVFTTTLYLCWRPACVYPPPYSVPSRGTTGGGRCRASRHGCGARRRGRGDRRLRQQRPARLFLANYGPNQRFLNLGNGTFRDVAVEQGSAGNFHSVAVKATDFDNDGLVDIYVTTFLGNDVRARDQLYRNAGRSFIDVLPENIGLDTNGNGTLDLVLANNHAEGTHYLSDR